MWQVLLPLLDQQTDRAIGEPVGSRKLKPIQLVDPALIPRNSYPATVSDVMTGRHCDEHRWSQLLGSWPQVENVATERRLRARIRRVR
jgi:hypothetical protein